MKEVQVIIFFLPIFLIILACSHLFLKLLQKTDQRLKQYPLYNLTLIVTGIILITYGIISGKSAASLYGIASGLTYAINQYKKIKSKKLNK